jgi:hypothetical protein
MDRDAGGQRGKLSGAAGFERAIEQLIPHPGLEEIAQDEE